MSFNAGATTRSMRGMGAQTGHGTKLGVDLNGAKFARLPWTTINNEVVTPGSGNVPRGVVELAWIPDTDDEATSVIFDPSTGLGTFAVEAGFPSGWLCVWYR